MSSDQCTVYDRTGLMYRIYGVSVTVDFVLWACPPMSCQSCSPGDTVAHVRSGHPVIHEEARRDGDGAPRRGGRRDLCPWLGR